MTKPLDPTPNNAWRLREIAAIDEALARYICNREELNHDGQGAERSRVVDEALDHRLKHIAAIREGRP